MKCPSCASVNPAEHRYCGMCGICLTHICSACYTSNPADHHFCGYCGARLSGIRRPEPADPLSSGADAPAPAPTSPLEGERRIATILLADVCGSTDLLDQVGTERWVILMNEMFQLIEAEIYRFGGQVDQFRGDGLVAFFGAAAAHEDDPERAVLAGLAMQRAMQRHGRVLAAREGLSLSLRVGVNTGEVIVTHVGDRARYSEDTAMGEAIAVAARMESAAQPGTVLVSAATQALTATAFEWEALGVISAKGIRAPIPVYRPLRHLERVDESAEVGIYRLGSQLVGRDAEFAALTEAVAALRGGRGRVVLLSGERGLGKSFLMAMVRQHVQRQEALLARLSGEVRADSARTITWLRGRGRSYDHSTPFALWLELLRNWLDVAPDAPAETVQAGLWDKVQALWGADAGEPFSVLARALSLPLDPLIEARVRALDGEQLRERVSQTLIHWVRALARRAPLVISLTNAQWADTSSIELLQRALPLCDSSAVLWIVIFRPERTAPVWDFRHFAETEYPHRLLSLTLSPLDPQQSAALLDSLVGPKALPPVTRTLLLEKAEGNPYYLRELVLSLVTSGALVQDADSGMWQVTHVIDSLELPDSLQSVLRARIDSLDPEARHVLQIAAAIGPVFWSDVLTALADSMDTTKLERVITTLQRAQFIYEREQVPQLGVAYVFKSTLVCDVVYDSLLSAQRRAYHRRIAGYFERQSAEESPGGSQSYGLLAHHYRHAGEPRQELRYTLKAAEQAQLVYANVEALDHYARALSIIDGLEVTSDESARALLSRQRVHALVRRSELLLRNGNLATWRGEAPKLLELARRLKGSEELLVDALLTQPGVAHWSSVDEVRSGKVLVEEGLALARQLGDRRREMLCLGTSASQHHVLNEPGWFALAEHALGLARELGDQRYELVLLTGFGNAFAMRDPRRSLEYLELALPIADALDDEDAELQLLFLLGVQMEDSIDYYRRIKDCHEKALRLARTTGNRLAEAQTLMFLGQLRALYLGDHEAGLAELEEALAMMGGTGMAPFALLRIAQIRLEQGRLAAAERALAQVQSGQVTQQVDAGQIGAARQLNIQGIVQIGRAGLSLLTIMLCNAYGDADHLDLGLRTAVAHKADFQENPEVLRHYEMVLASKLAETHSRLAQLVEPEDAREDHRCQALGLSQHALDVYESIGVVRPIELTSQEILFVHSQNLRLVGRESEANDALRLAHEELMRKHDLIPEGSHYRRTFLEQISLHRHIRATYALNIPRIRWDGSQVRLDLEA